uniref:ShKT domain-containing protein n=1 Tax=Caenorhabditis tropicalis TaxID=1561998 RepID=A0A1I7UUJ2_9PELO
MPSDLQLVSFNSFSNNGSPITDKYIPLLKDYCPVTCNLCPGATTTAPPTPNPNCYDASPQCKAWAHNGYCDQTFYTCAEKIKWCAKTCGFCTKGACKDH